MNDSQAVSAQTLPCHSFILILIINLFWVSTPFSQSFESNIGMGVSGSEKTSHLRLNYDTLLFPDP